MWVQLRSHTQTQMSLEKPKFITQVLTVSDLLTSSKQIICIRTTI